MKAFYEVLTEVGKSVAEADVEQGITPDDMSLAQIGFAVNDRRFHPWLYKREQSDLEASVDAIYAAASAGNTYAKFLIYAAARNLVIDAEEDAAAFPGGFQVTDEELEGYAFDFRAADQRHAPEPNALQALAMLDGSIAAIEVTLENVRNGLAVEGS